MWRVPFETGRLKVVSRKNGRIMLTKEIVTAGEPARIELIPDFKKINAGDDQLVFVKVRITDNSGNLVPDANLPLNFSITGPGTLVAVDNGVQTSMEPFQGFSRTSYNGLCLAIIKSTGKKGNIVLVAKSIELKGTTVNINVD